MVINKSKLEQSESHHLILLLFGSQRAAGIPAFHFAQHTNLITCESVLAAACTQIPYCHSITQTLDLHQSSEDQ